MKKSLHVYCCLIVEEEGNLWHRQLAASLRRMGHSVFLPPSVGLRDSWILTQAGVWERPEREQLTDRLIRDVREKHERHGLDVAFLYLYPFQFSTRLFKELDRLGIPSLYYFCDNFFHTDVAEKYAPFATLNWVPEVEALPAFKRSGSRFAHLPMAANPEVNFPVSCPEDTRAAFLGTKNPYRRELLGHLVEAQVPLTVFGDGWCPHGSYHSLELARELPKIEMTRAKRVRRFLRWKKNGLLQRLRHGNAPARRSAAYTTRGQAYDAALQAAAHKDPLSAEEANRVFSRAELTIGINDQFLPTRREPIVLYAKLREFEATMAGACYLTQWTPDLPGLFEEDKEVMVYRSAEELVDKAKFLLANPSTRRKLREAARRRALAEHDWTCRFETAFRQLGL